MSIVFLSVLVTLELDFRKVRHTFTVFNKIGVVIELKFIQITFLEIKSKMNIVWHREGSYPLGNGTSWVSSWDGLSEGSNITSELE